MGRRIAIIIIITIMIVRRHTHIPGGQGAVGEAIVREVEAEGIVEEAEVEEGVVILVVVEVGVEDSDVYSIDRR